MSMELLAPAGDFNCVKAAVMCGADAIYVGADKFSARKNATNFNKDELNEIISYCHIRGVKVYLALNTLISDNELESAFETAKHAYESGIDAYIVQDLGMADILMKNFDVPVHASTQMTVFDENGLKYLKKRGIKRAVLARECGKDEIARLAKDNDMELEVFCHGAICVCYSGQCLMSSMLGGRSANRGECAQPCRLPYKTGGKTGYYLSTKDLCLADEIDFLKKAGVKSVKIEGRMKGPSYVAAAVKAYRKCIDNARCDEGDCELLINAFSRGGEFTTGCYGGVRGKNMMNVATSNDDIYKTTDKTALKTLDKYWKDEGELKKIEVDAFFKVNERLTEFTLSDGEHFATVSTETSKEARGKNVDRDFAKAQLTKLGNTPYVLKYFECNINAVAYYSAAQLNAMRREATSLLSQKRDIKRISSKSSLTICRNKIEHNGKIDISVKISNKEQLKALLSAGASNIYVPIELADEENYGVYIPAVYKKLPKDLTCKKILVGSIGAYNYAEELGAEIVADYSMNIFNSVSAKMFDKVTLSTELSLQQCSYMAKYSQCEAVAYGYIPLMKTKNCIIRTSGQCKAHSCEGCRKAIELKDRKNVSFKLVSDGSFNTIYNSVPIFMADRLDELRSVGLSGIRLDFTFEKPEECVKIYNMYSGKMRIEMPEAYTRGHFYRGY